MEGNSSGGQQRRSLVGGGGCLKDVLASLHVPANALAHQNLLAVVLRK